MARPTYDPDSVLVGVIGRPHGLSGEMTLRVYNQYGADLSQVPSVILERGAGREVRKLRGARRSADGWLLRLERADSRAEAAALTHVAVRIQKQLLPPLAPGEFFVEDLLGCDVRTESGSLLGIVDSLFWNGAHDVLVIRPEPPPSAEVSDAGEGDHEHLIPLVPEFVRTVDAPARQLVVAWEAEDG
jgi:16S rRNA processing protein RimM